jgi:hypothetical protein
MLPECTPSSFYVSCHVNMTAENSVNAGTHPTQLKEAEYDKNYFF